MVSSIFNVLKYSSLIYLVIAILISVSWPLNNIFFFENMLFIPSFCFSVYIVLKKQEFFLKIAIITSLLFVSFFILEFISNQEIIFDHVLYLLRWIKYGVVFVLTLYFCKILNSNHLSYVIKGSFLILVLFNLIVFLNPFGIGESLQYIHSPKDEYALSNFREPGVFRLGGTFNNPNDNGVLFSLFFLIFILHTTLKDYYFAILSLLLIFLTQSRTSVFLVLCIVSIWVLYFLIKSQITKKQLYKVGVLVVALIFFFSFFNFSYVSTIFTGEAFQSKSFLIRVENFRGIIDSSFQELLFGRGVVNDQVAVFGTYLDSELSVVFAQFGLIGLLIWFGFALFMIKIALRNEVYSKVFLSCFILFLGISITNLSFLNTQLGLLLFFFLGISVKRGNEINNYTDEKTKQSPS